LGFSITKSVSKSKAILTRALRWPTVVGRPQGYPDFVAACRTRDAYVEHCARLTHLRGLYVITDSTLDLTRHEEIVRASLAGGARAVQLRDKSLPLPDLVRLAGTLSKLVRGADSAFIE